MRQRRGKPGHWRAVPDRLFGLHIVRHSLNYVSWKMRKAVAADLKTVYSAATADEALLRLQEFENQWGQDYPSIVKS